MENLKREIAFGEGTVLKGNRCEVIALTNVATTSRALLATESGALITADPSTDSATTITVTMPAIADAPAGVWYEFAIIADAGNAGADVIQIFDSWSGLLPKNLINDYCYIPNLKIVEFCKQEKIPSICFPKGLKEKYADFNEIVKPDGISLDSEVSPAWAKEKLKDVVIQGGLNPNMLLKSDKEMYDGATKYIKTFKDLPYIFNLGHGLLPQTDPDKVDKLVKFYRNF